MISSATGPPPVEPAATDNPPHRCSAGLISAAFVRGVQSVKNEYQAALIQEQTLTGALDQQKRDALALSRKGIDYGALQRDNATNRQVFESLLQRDDGRVQKYHIVGEDEADPKAGSISFVSPVERSLMGKAVGDVV